MSQAPPCPYCSASSYGLRDKRWLTCKECGQEFDLQRDLCRSCGRLNRSGSALCTYCQSPLSHDTVDRLISERSKDRLAWREERTSVGVAQKREEELASQRRMEAYWAEDRARREAQARARAEQKEREKKVLIAVVVIAGVLILLLIGLSVVLSLGKGAETSSIMPYAVPQGARFAPAVARHILQTARG